MANFNPGLNPTADPDYERSVGNVGLINAEAKNRGAEAERWDAFFKSASKGIGLLDKAVQGSSLEDVKAKYTELNKKYGLDAESTLQGESPTSPSIAMDKPPSAEQARIEASLRKTQAAYDQGKYNYSKYYAELETLMSGVKSRYPGYSDIIDKQVESITGVTPANALAKARMHEFNALQAQRTEKLTQTENFVLHNAEHLSQAQRDDLNSGKMTVDQAAKTINDRKGEVEDINREITRLSLLKKTNDLSAEEAEKGAGSVTFGIHRMAMDDVSTLASKAREDIGKGTYDPARYGLLLEQAKLSFQQKAMQAVEAGVGNSLSFEKKQKLINDAVGNFDNIAKVFTSKDSGMLDYLTTSLKAQAEMDKLGILKDKEIGDTMRAIQVARGFGGDAAVQQLMVDNGVGGPDKVAAQIKGALHATPAQINDPVTKKLTTDHAVSMGSGDTSVSSNDPFELLSNLHNLGLDSPYAIGRAMNMWKSSITNLNYGSTWNKNSAATLYKPENKDFLTKAFKDSYSRSVAFSNLVSPDITNAVRKMGGEVYENYKEWAYNGYIQVLKDSTHKLSAIVGRPYLDLKFNEENGHFDLVPSKLGLEAAKKYGASNAVQASVYLEKLLGKGISDDVRRLNSATDNISEIMKGDKYKTPEQIKNLVASLAMSTTGEKKGLWTWMAQQMMATEDILGKSPDDFEFGGKHPNFTTASGTNGEPRGFTSLIEEGNYGGALEALKGIISKGESGEDYNRLVNKRGSSEPVRAPLTDMTVGEVLNYQRGMKSSGHLSSAAGKYQILKGTLQSLINEGVLSSEDKYDKNTQEIAAEALLKRRGLDDYLKGTLPLRKFLSRLGDEWEIIKVNPRVAKKVANELQTLKDNQISLD